MWLFCLFCLKENITKNITEEKEKFMKEIEDFNNEYEITRKRELSMKENVKIEMSDLENQANILKMGMNMKKHLIIWYY